MEKGGSCTEQLQSTELNSNAALHEHATHMWPNPKQLNDRSSPKGSRHGMCLSPQGAGQPAWDASITHHPAAWRCRLCGSPLPVGDSHGAVGAVQQKGPVAIEHADGAVRRRAHRLGAFAIRRVHRRRRLRLCRGHAAAHRPLGAAPAAWRTATGWPAGSGRMEVSSCSQCGSKMVDHLQAAARRRPSPPYLRARRALLISLSPAAAAEVTRPLVGCSARRHAVPWKHNIL